MALLTEHTTSFFFVNLKGNAVWEDFFLSGILKCHLKTKIRRMIWTKLTKTTGVFRPFDPPKTFRRVALVLRFLPDVKKKKKEHKNKTTKKCDKPSPFAASMKTVYASPSLFVSPFSPLNWTESCRLHGLPFEAQMWRTTRVNCHPTSEAMSRTLFKHTRCHNK